jgi:hypothetical protein
LNLDLNINNEDRTVKYAPFVWELYLWERRGSMKEIKVRVYACGLHILILNTMKKPFAIALSGAEGS